MARRRYRQADAWRWLRRHPGARSPALAEAMGWTPNASAKILQRLKASGHARMGYLDHRRACRCAVWYAEGVAAPSNLWGTAPGSVKALRIGWNKWAAHLVLANAALGRNVKPRDKRPKAVADAHPLSAAWGMMPKSGTCQSSEVMVE